VSVVISCAFGVVAALGATKPIELPAVQEANCKRLSADDPVHGQCVRVRQILTLMSAEPRAAAWADGMESFLRRWMESLGPDGFTFHNVQCRLSWCVVEAESTVGAGEDRRGHNIVMDSAQAANKKLFQIENMFARKPDDATVWNVLVVFKRYCTSAGEVLDSDGHLVPNFDTLGQEC
jgi:hypothetical protein